MPQIATGKLPVEAALKKVGYTDSSARQQSQTTRNIRHNSAMQEALRKDGVTKAKLSRKVKEGQ